MKNQKPDKKRILIKKKREEGAEDTVAPLAAAEAAFKTAPSAAASGTDAVAHAPSGGHGDAVISTGPSGAVSSEEAVIRAVGAAIQPEIAGQAASGPLYHIAFKRYPRRGEEKKRVRGGAGN